MNLILDASASINYIMENDYSDILQKFIDTSNYNVAPDFYRIEIANVMWKYFKFKGFSKRFCEDTVIDCQNLIDKYLNTKTIITEAFALATLTSHSVFDCLYLVSARRMNFTLLTLDKKLIKIAHEHHIKVIDIYNE
jgi:predicted nucleic acid-binding protein